MALFHVDSRGQLMPIAIQLFPNFTIKPHPVGNHDKLINIQTNQLRCRMVKVIKPFLKRIFSDHLMTIAINLGKSHRNTVKQQSVIKQPSIKQHH